MKLIVAIFVALLTVASTAEARHYRHHSHHIKVQHRHIAAGSRATTDLTCDNNGRCVSFAADANSNDVMPAAPRGYYYDGRMIGSRPAGCPHAFCGCEASLYLFGRIIPELNLAANWPRKFPRVSPAPGMAAARSHHVVVLISHVEGSNWLVHDGNGGGHRTWEHVRSIAGYVVVNPHGSRMASR